MPSILAFAGIMPEASSLLVPGDCKRPTRRNPPRIARIAPLRWFFEGQVKRLMARGVKFDMCQNATRALIRSGVLPLGNATANIIDGVEYVTAGVTAIVDFEARGYRYVQP